MENIEPTIPRKTIAQLQRRDDSGSTVVWRDEDIQAARGSMLEWRDPKYKVVPVMVDDFTIRLIKQEDTNQCGPASIFNLNALLGMGEVPIDQIRRDIPYNLRGQVNREIDHSFWFTISAVNHKLKEIYGSDNVSRFMRENTDINDYKGFVILQNSHFVSVANKNGQWYLVDSLNPQSNQPLISRIEPSNIQNIILSSQGLIAVSKPRLEWR